MKRIHLILIFLFIVFTYKKLIAQNVESSSTILSKQSTLDKCGFDNIHQQLLQVPSYQQAMLRNAENIRKYKNSGGNRDGVTTIPVVVHVMHHGDALGTGGNIPIAQIESAITNMNDAFSHSGTYNDGAHNAYIANTNARFALAQTAPDGTLTTGINRIDVSGEAWQANYNTNGISTGGMFPPPGVAETDVKSLSRWPSSDYMNIWLVNRVNGGNLCSGVIGYAYFPGAPWEVDGMVVIAGGFGYDATNTLWPATLCNNLNLNGTANHEGGHYFNLFHTFAGDNGGASCPGAPGDECADTPPHIRSGGCPADSPNSNACVGGGGPNTYIHNFMDYSSDACYHGFSGDQKTRIDASIATTGIRSGFCSATGTSSPTGTYPAAAACTPTNTDPDFGLGTSSLNLNGATWYSQGEFGEGAYVDKTVTQITIDIMAGSTYTVSVTAATGNDEQSHIYIDYNNDGDFIDTNEDIGTTSTLNPSGMLSFTVPSSGVTLTQRLRFRIITDFASNPPISGSCYNPQYGQIEDYAVRIAAALPVELSHFDLNVAKNKINLDWTTATEINNDYFIMEKSKDGFNFEELALINSAGNAIEVNNYQHVDESPYIGLNYYRLKQVDFNGSHHYSKIISGEVFDNTENISLYPNPTKGDVFIDYNGTKDISAVHVYNQLGEKVRSFNQVEGRVSLIGLSQGVYFVAIEVNDKLQIFKKIFVE